jgi:hypothetical protein
VHEERAGKTQRLAGEAFETRAQRQVLAFDLLHRQFSYRVLRGREMALIDTRLVCVIPGDAKRRQQGLEFQKHRILASTYNIREHSPCAMIERMPQPSLSLFDSAIQVRLHTW